MMTAFTPISAPTFAPTEDSSAQLPPRAIAFQPHGCLDQESCQKFCASLIRALEQVSGTVIVDLLWVDQITSEAITLLGTAMALAIQLNKGLVFQFANAAIQLALDEEWSRQRAIAFPRYTEHYSPDFDRFLHQPSHQLPDLDQLMHQEPVAIERPVVASPKYSFPVLSASAYTEEGWRSSLLAS